MCVGFINIIAIVQGKFKNNKRLFNKVKKFKYPRRRRK